MPTSYRVSPNIVHRNLNNKVILLEIEGDRLYELEDDVSIRIWELLIAGKDVEETVEAIESEFETDSESRKHVEDFIKSLEGNKIISPR